MEVKVLGYARAWHAAGEVPKKERNENGRWAWPARFKFYALTEKQVSSTDVPLIALTDEVRRILDEHAPE